VGEGILMKFKYSKAKEEIIKCHENKMLERYHELIQKYASLIKSYNCEISLGLYWLNSNTKEYSESKIPINQDSRIKIQNGYVCYVFCSVIRDGEIVKIESDDGEVDYYLLSETWQVTSVFKPFFTGTNGYLIDFNFKEAKKDIEWFLECLENEKRLEK